jgi:cytidine deaminase
MKKKMAFGENSSREFRAGCCYGEHAEAVAVGNLPITRTKRNIPIDIIVVRISKSGKLKSSAPCSKCLQHMQKLCETTGYKIKCIYYSDADGNLVKAKFLDLITSSGQHISRRFRK